ncbi:MAG: metal-dependent transcriptional regulator [Actinomycetaceae bacterium]|nr:metal-dependent transcriptional regulator [Actinomycetaceae bacterium]
MGDLIDTTEMYLKTIYELNEDGIVPMRARIVERIGHSGPTVSQTIARMERDGLVVVGSDRKLNLTDEGAALATEVMRKHRLAERLLLDVIGLDWELVHDEACRWEHVMSDQVEKRLLSILECSKTDPYGNPVPREAEPDPNLVSLAKLRKSGAAKNVENAKLARIGEPIQADPIAMRTLADMDLRPGAEISITFLKSESEIRKTGEADANGLIATIPEWMEGHLFIHSPK